MSENIQFDEFKIKSRSIFGQSESPAMMRYLIKKGIVKNENQAFKILMSIMVICILLSIFIVYNSFFKVTPVPPMTAEDELLMNQLTGQTQ